MRRVLSLLTLAMAGMLLSGCVGSMPNRFGYDRATGSWKRSHAPTTGSSRGVAPVDATPMTDTVAPARELSDGSPAVGIASWYGHESSGTTASGEPFNPADMTAAHRTLPFGTKLRVRYPRLKTQVEVRVNDRGPQKTDRILDLSEGAAAALGLKADGTGEVWLDELP